MRYILFPKEADAHSPIGGKARTLAKLGRAGLPVPPWFALTYDAYHAGINGSLSPAVQGELMQALEELCPHGEPVAVRSSAADEDGARHSLAGQLDSFLFVPPDRVAALVLHSLPLIQSFMARHHETKVRAFFAAA